MSTSAPSRRVHRPVSPEPSLKTCPECAEEVRAAARRCRFCDFRFEPLVSVGPEGLQREAPTEALPKTEVVGDDMPAEEAPVEQPATAPATERSPRKWRVTLPSTKRGRLQLGAAGVAFLLLLAGVVAWRVMESRANFAEQSDRAAAASTALAASLEDFGSGDASAAADDLRALTADQHDALREMADDASSLGDGDRARALLTFAKADQSLVDEVATALDAELGSVTSAGLDKLDPLERTVNDAAADLNDHVDGSPFATVDVEAFKTAAAAAAFDYKKRAAFIVKRRAELTKAAAAKRAKLESVRTYAGGFRGVLDRYAQSREDMQDFTDRARSGMSFAEAYQTLDQQASRRQQLRSEFAALTAPPEMSAAHGSLLRIVDRAIDATQAASLGIAEYQFDLDGDYVYFEQAPSWQRFQTESASITRDYDSVVTTWNSTLTSVERRIGRKTTLPPLLGPETL